jgi:hypothetical protein
MDRSTWGGSVPAWAHNVKNYESPKNALRGVSKPIGVSEYELIRTFPPKLRSALRPVEELDAPATRGKDGFAERLPNWTNGV